MPRGRPAAIYLPMPVCENGHRRTVKNTRWYDQLLCGKYRYRIARCMICEARAAHRRQWLKKFNKPKPGYQQPLQIDGGAGG